MAKTLQKSFFYAFIFLVALNLQGMENTDKPLSKNTKADSWFSKKTAHSALKFGIKAAIDWAPTLYTYGKPVILMGGHILTNRIKIFTPSYSVQELREKSDGNGFSGQFLDMAADTINAVGLDQPSVSFCNVREATFFSEELRNKMGAPNKTFGGVDQHGIFSYGDWFKALPLDEQQFIFAHELIHFKEKHLPLQIYGGIALPFVTHLGIIGYKSLAHKGINYCAQKYDLKNNKLFQNCVMVHNAIVGSGLFHSFITALAMYKFLNYSEIRADIGAALALKTAQGGINVCNRWLRENPKNYVWYDISDYHPSDKTRLSYLTTLQTQFEKEQSLK